VKIKAIAETITTVMQAVNAYQISVTIITIVVWVNVVTQ
jgi:hypothetical protein